MPNTYTQIYVQIVFAVEGRQNLISPDRKEELQKCITGIVTRQNQKLLAIHCMPDHTHILIGLKPSMRLSDLVGDIKTGSTNHINENKWVLGRFSWQEGFGAFSYGHSQLTAVIRYIQNQSNITPKKAFTVNTPNSSKNLTFRTTKNIYSHQSIDHEMPRPCEFPSQPPRMSPPLIDHSVQLSSSLAGRRDERHAAPTGA